MSVYNSIYHLQYTIVYTIYLSDMSVYNSIYYLLKCLKLFCVRKKSLHFMTASFSSDCCYEVYINDSMTTISTREIFINIFRIFLNECSKILKRNVSSVLHV